jgi:hypothetical protein
MNYGICDEAGVVIAKFVVPTTVSSNHPVFSTDTLNLHRKTMLRGAQRWEIKSNVSPLKETAEELFVNLVTKGYHEVLQIKVPQNIGVISKMRLQAEANLLATIPISGRANSTTSRYGSIQFAAQNIAIPKGTLITLSGDEKVYMLVTSITSTSTSADLFPQLLKVTTSSGEESAGGTLTYCGVVMQCKYDTGTIQGMTYQDGILMDVGAINLVENL